MPGKERVVIGKWGGERNAGGGGKDAAERQPIMDHISSSCTVLKPFGVILKHRAFKDGLVLLRVSILFFRAKVFGRQPPKALCVGLVSSCLTHTSTQEL